jgi:hypothetical protein
MRVTGSRYKYPIIAPYIYISYVVLVVILLVVTCSSYEFEMMSSNQYHCLADRLKSMCTLCHYMCIQSFQLSLPQTHDAVLATALQLYL